MFRYRSVSMGFGLEGVNGADAQNEVTTRTLDWLLDELTVMANARFGGRDGKTAFFHATAASSAGATAVKYRWDFGDRSPIVTNTGPDVAHRYTSHKDRDARVEVTDSLGHRSVVHIDVGHR